MRLIDGCWQPGTIAAPAFLLEFRLMRALLSALLCLPLAAAASPDQALAPLAFERIAPAGVKMPRFKVDAAWPAMPEDLLLGQVSGVAVGPDDSVWVVHRPQSLTNTDTGLAQNPPIAVCCKAAPPVVRFAADGRYLSGWAGRRSPRRSTASINGPPACTVCSWTRAGVSGSAATARAITSS